MDLFQREMPLNEADPNNLLMHINRHLERIHAMSSLTIDDLKQAILGDPVLKAALTGSTEQNYGGSLIKSALEKDVATGWTGTFTVGETYKGLKSFNVTGVATSPMFPFDKDFVLKVSFYMKVVSGTPRVFFYSYDKDGNAVLKSNGGLSTFLDPSGFTANAWKKHTLYFSNVGTGSNEFAESPFLQFYLSSTTGSGNILYNRVVLEQVSTGEPVPFNLPFLPSGQMVFDPTDGSVGRYDGTTIQWFTME